MIGCRTLIYPDEISMFVLTNAHYGFKNRCYDDCCLCQTPDMIKGLFEHVGVACPLKILRER